MPLADGIARVMVHSAHHMHGICLLRSVLVGMPIHTSHVICCIPDLPMLQDSSPLCACYDVTTMQALCSTSQGSARSCTCLWASLWRTRPSGALWT